MIIHQLCHSLLVRSKSQVMPVLKGNGLYKDMNMGDTLGSMGHSTQRNNRKFTALKCKRNNECVP